MYYFNFIEFVIFLYAYFSYVNYFTMSLFYYVNICLYTIFQKCWVD